MSYPTKLGTYNYKGCWNDGGNRALPEQVNDGNWTIQQCKDAAVAKNKDTFALQYYGQCFIGDSSKDNYQKYGPAQNCPSNGGAWNQQVYAIKDPSPYLNSDQLNCYQQRYPDLKGMNNQQLLDHWINIGSKQSRSYDCPAPQAISGSYELKGCYNDLAQNTGKRSIPNQRNNVNNIDDCKKQAESNGDTVFGVQYYGECWSGKDVGQAMKSVNYNKDQCGNMGKAWTNQVYVRSTPFPVPITNASCEYKMSPIELQCYRNTYPDLAKLNDTDLQKHWSTIGCKQNRNNQCPSPQTNSGLYNFQGCYNDLATQTGKRSIPNQRNHVNNVDACQKQAEANGDNVFGVQYYGECWSGKDEAAAMKSPNYNKDQCGNLGKGWTNQVYKRSKPFPPPLPPVPSLQKTNFSQYQDTTTINPNSFEKFDNQSSQTSIANNEKVINSGFTQLYNPIFCDLFKTNNGFETCEDCTLDAKNVWKTTTQNTEQSCLTNCDNDIRCTSYTYDNTKKTDNCTSYIDFPTKINNGIKNINSGYNLKFGYNYENLNNDQKNNVKNKCANQYLNNIFDKSDRVNISECITFNNNTNVTVPTTLNGQSVPFGGKNLNTTKINVDPKCLYNIYSKKGKEKIVNLDSYIEDNSNNVKTDPIIDEYQKVYNNFNLLSGQNKKINNNLSVTDVNYKEFNNNVNIENKNLQSSLNNSIEDKENNITINVDEIQDIIGTPNKVNRIQNIKSNIDNINNIPKNLPPSPKAPIPPTLKNYNNMIIDLINQNQININNFEKFSNFNEEAINIYTNNNFLKYLCFIIFIILIVFIIFIIFKKK